jgi:hypothetical protein
MFGCLEFELSKELDLSCQRMLLAISPPGGVTVRLWRVLLQYM